MTAEQRTPITGIEQGRAAYAFAEVKAFVQQNGEKKQGNFRAYVKRMPSMVQTNGLAQTLAFYFAKGDEHRDIYRMIAKRIESAMPGLMEPFKSKGQEEFIEILVNMNSSEYRLVTMEVLSLLNWMRRFADGLIQTKQG